MSQKTSKIAFRKKLPVATVKKPVSSAKNDAQSQPHPMRLIANSKGQLVDVNDAFAATIGIMPHDLVNRNLLDTVLFKNFDDLIDDRALFNNLSQGDDMGLANLRPGQHTLLMGTEHAPHDFHFDWIKGQDGQKYLVATSLIKDDKPQWDDFLDNLTSKTETQNNAQPAQENVITTSQPIQDELSETYVGQQNTESFESTPLTQDDASIFANINRNIQCVMEPDGTILRHNDVLLEKMTHKCDETHLSFLQLIHHDDRSIAKHFLQSLQEPEDANPDLRLETKMDMPEDNPLWIHWRMHMDGTDIYCIGHDITQTKTVELSLKRREQELSEAQALAHMGHWRWCVGSETLDWSDAVYQIFGVSRDEFQPTLDNANSLIHKRDIGHMMQAFQRAIIEQNDYDVDFRVVHTDKSIRYVRCEGRCELDTDGDVIALYGVMQDVTEQAEHEQELRSAKESAEQAYASKSRFLANMSHELRTPLNAIIGFSDMINSQMLGAIGNEKYLEYAQNIKDSGEHLLALITDILDMSKIEAGKYELDIENIELGGLVNSAVRMIEARAKEGVITLKSEIETNDPIIKADRRAVMQILLNILSNAVKFTEPGGEINVSIAEFENHVNIKIADNGIGIPANKLSAVLRPFEQVSAAHTRNHEGSGLGLTITKELAELHGGMISLESTVGEGTVASIRLPRDGNQG